MYIYSYIFLGQIYQLDLFLLEFFFAWILDVVVVELRYFFPSAIK